MNRKMLALDLIAAFAMVLSACGSPAAPARKASFTDLEEMVQIRLSSEGQFGPAGLGEELRAGAQVQTNETGKARLAIQPDETLIYVGPNTLFTLTELASEAGENWINRLKLELGQLWIVLRGGSLEVETPSGVASVRGSYMGVGYGPDGELTVTCLEGHCNLTNEGGSTDMADGDACDVQDAADTCEERDITDEENELWEDNVPESDELLPDPTATFTPSPTATPTPQSTSQAGEYGPDLDDFPPGINPLTGLPVNDPTTLGLPAIMLSIPLFPAGGRPLAGVGSSPWIFEIYIGEGMTRLLATFYGDLPSVQPNPSGSCEVRVEPFEAGEFALGNRAWVDQNADGVQQPSELGIGGICVTLYAPAGNALQTTSTDSNGYYAFNIEPDADYLVGFEDPAALDFTTVDVGLDDLDSDADPNTGLTAPIHVTGSSMDWDAGYVWAAQPEVTPDPGGGGGGYEGDVTLPPAEVGPIRSMRLPYGRIAGFFQGGCIVSASGDPSILAQVPGCRYVYGQDENDINSALLDITDLHELAVQNQKPYPLNYSGNIFNPMPPAGGLPASQVQAIWSWGNQSLYRYDPLSHSYLRFANLPDTPLDFYSQTDRLNGRQLMYENVLFMYVEHIYYAETKIDVELTIGMMGRAYLFRDGMFYRIYWDTVAQEYEQETQRTRPIRFTDANGNPFPLRPGHSWVHIFSPGSFIYEKQEGSGQWTADFYAPAGP
jgi:hypothetical protein